MKRLLQCVLAMLVLAAPLDAQGPPDRLRAPRALSMTLSQVLQSDTLVWRVSWDPAVRGRLGAPIERYLLIWRRSTTPGGTGTEIGTNRVPADSLVVERRFPHDCLTQPTAFYRVRIKAEGSWDPSEVPWAETPDYEITCGGPPGAVPSIRLDTINVDTLALDRDPEPADHAELAIVETGDFITWYPEQRRLYATVLWQTVRGCILSYRDGAWYRRATGPTAFPTGGGFEATAVPGSEWSCWDLLITVRDGETMYISAVA